MKLTVESKRRLMNSSDSSTKNNLQIYSLVNIVSVGLEHSYRNFVVGIYGNCLEGGSTRTNRKTFYQTMNPFPALICTCVCVYVLGLCRRLGNQLI